jgi:hypothetical protein
MEGIPRYLVMAAVAAVFVVLLAGWEHDARHQSQFSQTLMRWQVGLQFLAIVLMMITAVSVAFMTGCMSAPYQWGLAETT